MHPAPGNLLDRVRHFGYTGDRRCVPCTLLNLYVAAISGLSVALARSELFGAAVFVSLGLVVYFRGYLVPGFPSLTTIPVAAFGWCRQLFGENEAPNSESRC